MPDLLHELEALHTELAALRDGAHRSALRAAPGSLDRAHHGGARTAYHEAVALVGEVLRRAREAGE